MKKHVTAFLDKYRAVIITTLILCFAFVGQAQVYQQYNQYGGQWKRLRIDSLLAIPRDTSTVPSAQQAYPQIASKGDTLYLWSTGQDRWIQLAVGGGGFVGNCTELIDGGSITPQGGFRFTMAPAIARIDCQIYYIDSLSFTADSADATYDRFDVPYLAADGFHLLEGTPAENPSIPQVLSNEIPLTVVSIEAGAIQANISTINVYFENDATITPSGTTAVGNSTVFPYAGTYHIRITTINNGDYIDIIKTSGTWDIAGQDFLAFHIKNLAVVPQLANLRASLWNGSCTGCQVSGEVILNYNKFNITTYNALSIPFAALGTITNTNIDRIRLRFTSNNANNFTGYELDNIFFGDNLQQPGNGGTGQFTLNVPSFLTLTPSNTILTNNTTYTLSAIGNSSQYIDGGGALRTFNAVTAVGAVNSETKSTNGATTNGANLILQDVDASFRGLVTPTMKLSWDSVYTVEELSSLGYPIMIPIDEARTGFKRMVFDNVNKNTDSTIHIDTTGGGAAYDTSHITYVNANYTVLPTDRYIVITQLSNITLTLPDATTNTGRIIYISSPEGVNTSPDFVYKQTGATGSFLSAYSGHVLISDGTNWEKGTFGWYNTLISTGIGESIIGGYATSLQSGYITQNVKSIAEGTGIDIANDGTTLTISATGGGGASPFLPVTGTGTATGNVIGDLDGNNLSINDADTITLSGRIIGVGIDDVLAEEQALTTQRTIFLNGNELQLVDAGSFYVSGPAGSLLDIDPSFFNLIARDVSGSETRIDGSNAENSASLDMYATFGEGGVARILATATDVAKSIAYTAADGHTFTGGIKFNSLAAGASTDSVMVWNATTKAVGYLSPSSFGGGTPALTQYRIAVGDASNLLSDNDAITASRALVSDANGVPVAADPSTTELNYVDGVTSAIQAQIDNKQNLIGQKRIFWIAANTTSSILTVGTNPATASGTITTPAQASTNALTATRRVSLSTGAAAPAVARISTSAAELWRGDAAGLGGFTVVYRFGLNTTVTGNRVFVGLIDNTAFAGNVDPTTSTATARIGMCLNAATGNWQFATNTSGVAPTVTDLGANFAVNTTDLLELKMHCDPNAGSITYTATNLSTGNTTSATASSNLPANTSFLTMWSWICNNATASAAIIDVAKMYAETNY